MKKLLVSFIVVLILLCISTIFSSKTVSADDAKSEYPRTGYVNTSGEGLNVRATASTSAKKLGELKKGSSVTVTGKSGNWYSVKYNDKKGWVSSQYITFKKPVKKTFEYPKTGYVNASAGLNVRASASTSAKKLGVLKKGKSITITGKSGNWYSIKYNNKKAWVSTNYITFNKPKTSSTKIDISKPLPKSKQKMASNATFSNYLNTLYAIEGKVSNDKADPGGLTKYGITAATYKIYYPKKSVLNITYSQAKEIYRKGYWNPLPISLSTERLAIVLFDTSVHQGSTKAIKILQDQIGVKANGIIGSATKKKLKTYSKQQLDDLALKILQVRSKYRSNNKKYLEGWANRDRKVYSYLKGL